MTLTQKIVDYVTTNPGKTATQVAHGIDGGPATVSGILEDYGQIIAARVGLQLVNPRYVEVISD